MKTALEVFLQSLIYQVNHKIQAGLPSEPLKNIVMAVTQELRKLEKEK
jgi:hypothetical protein